MVQQLREVKANSVRWRMCGLLISNKYIGIAVFCGILIVSFSYITGIVRLLFPEADMVWNSNCLQPMQNWDGKIFDFQIVNTHFYDKPKHYNIHYDKDAPSLGPLKRFNDKPIIIWGSHHKTGTFLAKKIFAKMCAEMNWCCLFHVTRDSLHAISSALQSEPVDVIGYNQWIWEPSYFNLTNFRFIHFYRHPFKKVISGYRYHYDGAESWTKKNTLKFSNICAAKPIRAKYYGESADASLSRAANVIHVTKDSVYDYCASTYLCETCCRKEHELENVFGRDISAASLKYYQNLTNASSQPQAHHPHHHIHHDHSTGYALRDEFEYDFACAHLGKLNASLYDTLRTIPAEEGIMVEASMDFYKSLRMAKIFNQTFHDPRTLNIDLDYINSHYDQAMWKIMHHIADFLPRDEKALKRIHKDLLFYDLQTSPMYRWSMSNPINNHVDSSDHKYTSAYLMKILQDSKDIERLYRTVYEQMSNLQK